MVARIADAAEAGADLVVLPEQGAPDRLSCKPPWATPSRSWRLIPTPPLRRCPHSRSSTASGCMPAACRVRPRPHLQHLAAIQPGWGPGCDISQALPLRVRFRERRCSRRGDDVVVVPTPLGPTGLATCYDLRFGEHFRALLDAGAESVLISAGWPSARLAHWDLLLRARAIENQTLMIGCNAAGESGDVPLAADRGGQRLGRRAGSGRWWRRVAAGGRRSGADRRNAGGVSGAARPPTSLTVGSSHTAARRSPVAWVT